MQNHTRLIISCILEANRRDFKRIVSNNPTKKDEYGWSDESFEEAWDYCLLESLYEVQNISEYSEVINEFLRFIKDKYNIKEVDVDSTNIFNIKDIILAYIAIGIYPRQLVEKDIIQICQYHMCDNDELDLIINVLLDNQEGSRSYELYSIMMMSNYELVNYIVRHCAKAHKMHHLILMVLCMNTKLTDDILKKWLVIMVSVFGKGYRHITFGLSKNIPVKVDYVDPYHIFTGECRLAVYYCRTKLVDTHTIMKYRARDIGYLDIVMLIKSLVNLDDDEFEREVLNIKRMLKIDYDLMYHLVLLKNIQEHLNKHNRTEATQYFLSLKKEGEYYFVMLPKIEKDHKFLLHYISAIIVVPDFISWSYLTYNYLNKLDNLMLSQDFIDVCIALGAGKEKNELKIVLLVESIYRHQIKGCCLLSVLLGSEVCLYDNCCNWKTNDIRVPGNMQHISIYYRVDNLKMLYDQCNIEKIIDKTKGITCDRVIKSISEITCKMIEDRNKEEVDREYQIMRNVVYSSCALDEKQRQKYNIYDQDKYTIRHFSIDCIMDSITEIQSLEDRVHSLQVKRGPSCDFIPLTIPTIKDINFEDMINKINMDIQWNRYIQNADITLPNYCRG